jgi:hypothetical protein
LKDSGDCPECGAPIERSLHGDRLVAANPQWLSSIVRGHRLVWIGVLSTLLCGLAAMGALMTVMLLGMHRSGLADVIDPILMVLFGCALVGVPISMGIGAIGVFWLTAKEGRETYQESPLSSRIIARWSVIAAIALVSVSLAIGYVPILVAGWVVASLATRVLAIAAITIAVVALFQRLAALVRRIPDARLAKQIDEAKGVFRWGIPVAGLAIAVVPAFGAAPLGNIGLATSDVFTCGGFIAILALLVNSVLLAVIMHQCATRFRMCIAESEQYSSTADEARTRD